MATCVGYKLMYINAIVRTSMFITGASRRLEPVIKCCLFLFRFFNVSFPGPRHFANGTLENLLWLKAFHCETRFNLHNEILNRIYFVQFFLLWNFKKFMFEVNYNKNFLHKFGL